MHCSPLSPPSPPLSLCFCAHAQLNLKQEIKGIAANHTQEEEVWDDFFDGDGGLPDTLPAADGISESSSASADRIESFLRLSSVASRKRTESFAVDSAARKFLPPYDRDLTELKYLIHCTPSIVILICGKPIAHIVSFCLYFVMFSELSKFFFLIHYQNIFISFHL